MSSFNQRECLGCGQPCDGYHCYSCTCPQCGAILLNGICINCIYGDGKPVTCCECEGPLRGRFCLFCNSKAENSFTYDPNTYSFNDTSSNFNHLPQPQLCGNDSHYGYDCQPQFPFVYEQKPSCNQNYNDNYYPHDLPSCLCCDNCGGSYETFQCQPMDQNIDSSGFDQIQTPQYPFIHHPSQKMSEEVFQAKGDLKKSIQTFLEKFNRIPFGEKPKILLQVWEKFFAIQHAQPEDTNELFQKLLKDLQMINKELAEYINSSSWDRPIFFNDNEEHSVQYKEYLENFSNELVASNSNQEKEKLPQDSDIRQFVREECGINVCEEQKQNMEYTMLELIEVCRQKEFYCMDNNVDDLIESALSSKLLSINLESQRLDKKKQKVKNIVELPTKHGTRKVLESSVKNLVPIPSEYEVTSDDESECDVPIKDESSPAFTTFSNPLFNDNDDFTSSDDESLSEEDVPMENFKVYSNPLFDDEEINSDNIDPYYFNAESDLIESLLNRYTLINSSPKFDFLLKEFSELNAEIADTIVESLSPSPIPVEDSDSLMDGIDLFLATDDLLPPGIENDDYDSEGDIYFLEELHVNDSISIPENESSNFDHHDDPLFSRPPPEPPDVEFDFKPNSGEVISVVKNNNDELNEDNCFDPGDEIDIFANVEDDDYFPFIFVIRIFLPYLMYPEVSPLLLSVKSEDTIFDPGIST
nr:hypothetical protein [Tanacetum cinerariifolium]